MTATIGADAPYFADVHPPGASHRSVFDKMAQVVGVVGDTRRGQKPFPHPFPARMPIEVAKAAVSAISKPGDVVLDPMSGSGVVPRAALDLGRRAIGCDLDPLAVVQARALCSTLSATAFVEIAAAVRERAATLLAEHALIEAQWSALDDEGRRFVGYWFNKPDADQLFALSLAIDAYTGRAEWPVLATLVSSLIISRGSGASLAMDLSRSRPHKVANKVPKAPFDGWASKVAAFERYYRTHSAKAHSALGVGDARTLDLEDDSVDAIVTSPPYLNAIDYMRTSKFSLVFFGSRLAELRATRASSVGTEVGLAEGALPASLDRLVMDKVSDHARRPMLRRYLHDMRAALSESYRVLKPGGRALYVMGPSILSRRDYDAGRVLTQLAESVGYRGMGFGRRDICEERRSLPPPRRSDRAQPMNRRMSCEFYVALQKPLD